MNLKEALPTAAEIVLGTTEIGNPREGNQLAAAALPAGMTVALALPILITNFPPVETIAGEAGVPRPRADRPRAPLSNRPKSRSPTQQPQQVIPIVHSTPPDPSLILLTSSSCCSCPYQRPDPSEARYTARRRAAHPFCEEIPSGPGVCVC